MNDYENNLGNRGRRRLLAGACLTLASLLRPPEVRAQSPRRSVKDFGAVGNGVIDDTDALVAAAAAIQSGQTIFFPKGIYLISYRGAPYSSVHGNVVMNFLGKTDIALVGDSATIKVADHNIATYGGLRFANFKACKRVLIEGLNFAMSYTGMNTSGSFYPFCGALTFIDDPAAGQPQSALNGDVRINRCTFKLFHPWGAFVTTSNPYLGDPNNGYKIIPVFASGPARAVVLSQQCSNFTITNSGFERGHNTYGYWVWAWNNVIVDKCYAKDAVGRSSDTSGKLKGGGFTFFRYHQWHCSGLSITNNHFKARPCSERTTAGFEGPASFVALGQNLGGDHKHGRTVIRNNTIILGNGDAASGAFTDTSISIHVFGEVLIEDNTFDSISDTSNAANGGKHIYYGAFEAGGNGSGALIINRNTFGPNNSYLNSIIFDNNSRVSENHRRCKSLIVTNNTSLSQAAVFISMAGTAAPHKGCRETIISDNIIDGTNNTLFPPTNSTSKAIILSGTAADDQIVSANNQIKGKYYGYFATKGDLHASTKLKISGNQFSNVAVQQSGIFNI